MATTTLSAPDIVCDGCANSIKNALGRLPGVRNVQVDVNAKTVTVDHEAPQQAIVQALDKAGFPAEVK